MSVDPELSHMLAQTPEALQALAALVESERIVKPPTTLQGNLDMGVIPVEAFRADQDSALAEARARISREHERVLCARWDHELEEGIDPFPDPLARQYLGLVGLLEPDEALKPELPADQ